MILKNNGNYCFDMLLCDFAFKICLWWTRNFGSFPLFLFPWLLCIELYKYFQCIVFLERQMWINKERILSVKIIQQWVSYFFIYALLLVKVLVLNPLAPFYIPGAALVTIAETNTLKPCRSYKMDFQITDDDDNKYCDYNIDDDEMIINNDNNNHNDNSKKKKK